mmetsp:Transcript_12847/g.14842  ORF Transcript_12847/g.14842 Transcript_12847/m.14842 type:complete len:116 (+) Transcript_12847:41-388(+)
MGCTIWTPYGLQSSHKPMMTLSQRISDLSIGGQGNKRKGRIIVKCGRGENCCEEVDLEKDKCPKGHKCKFSSILCGHCKTKLADYPDISSPTNFCPDCGVEFRLGILTRYNIIFS